MHRYGGIGIEGIFIGVSSWGVWGMVGVIVMGSVVMGDIVTGRYRQLREYDYKVRSGQVWGHRPEQRVAASTL